MLTQVTNRLRKYNYKGFISCINFKDTDPTYAQNKFEGQ